MKIDFQDGHDITKKSKLKVYTHKYISRATQVWWEKGSISNI